jgi:hypothetical protein
MIRALASTMRRGDPAVARRVFRRFPDDRINGRRYYLFLDILLGMAVKERLGEPPIRENVDRLATEIYPAWSKIVRFDRQTLRDMMLTACELLEPAEQITDRRVSGSASAALGVLLHNPRRDLQRLRPHLAAYLKENEAEARQHGFID